MQQQQLHLRLSEYAKGTFVRWAIVIGTVELFHRESENAFKHQLQRYVPSRPGRNDFHWQGLDRRGESGYNKRDRL